MFHKMTSIGLVVSEKKMFENVDKLFQFKINVKKIA